MYKLCIENALGELYDLTNRRDEYYILDIQGLTVPKVKVNTKEFAGFDGSSYNSSKVEERNIVINIMLRGDIETSRQRLYRIFLIKREITIYFRNKYRSLKIKGYTESIEGDLFVQQEQMQVSVICPKPFFEAENPTEAELSEIVSGFQFPFSIKSAGISFSEIYNYPVVVLNNPGDVACGATIEMKFLDYCRIPKITNILTGQILKLNGTFLANDKVTICTIPGNLSVKWYSSIDGEERNILSYFTSGSSWFEILPGNNLFRYEDGDKNEGYKVSLIFRISPLYGGV